MYQVDMALIGEYSTINQSIEQSIKKSHSISQSLRMITVDTLAVLILTQLFY